MDRRRLFKHPHNFKGLSEFLEHLHTQTHTQRVYSALSSFLAPVHPWITANQRSKQQHVRGRRQPQEPNYSYFTKYLVSWFPVGWRSHLAEASCYSCTANPENLGIPEPKKAFCFTRRGQLSIALFSTRQLCVLNVKTALTQLRTR